MRSYIAAVDAVFAEVPGGGVVLHTGTKRYYSLNETGARIWALLEARGDPGDAAQTIATEYGISPADAEQAVTALVHGLTAAGLLIEANQRPEARS
jgi:hypothetical protein